MYDFTSLDVNFDAVVSSGWLVGLRLLTSRVVEAPTYLSGLGIRTLHGGVNYDPADPTFHARYLALLEALRERRYCQNESLRMMYAGCASSGNESHTNNMITTNTINAVEMSLC